LFSTVIPADPDTPNSAENADVATREAAKAVKPSFLSCSY